MLPAIAAPAGIPAGSPAAPADDQANMLPLSRLRDQFEHFATVKAEEIEEQREAWRYYHGKQWTKEQLAVLAKRRQPPIMFNRVGRKIDGVSGIIQKLRGDPKVFPKGPSSEDGAELATNVIRSVLEDAHFQSAVEADCLRDAAVHGTGVLELSLVTNGEGEPDIDLAYVDPTTFFYDPRSKRLDFSDAKFLGVSKWMDRDDVEEMFPGKAEALYDGMSDDAETAHDADKEPLWMQAPDRVRLVEHWYRVKGQWRVKFHCGMCELSDMASPFVDERGASIPRFFGFSWGCDHDGNRYGLIRALKGPQDAINQHRSKAAHIMNTRQIVARKGALGADIERARQEAARPDGILEVEGRIDEVRIEQANQEFLQQTEYFNDAKQEIENFGPNPALLGDDDIKNRSGRALTLMQQSGITELGAFLSSYRNWKLRIYRAIWAQAQKNWTQARIIRTADIDDPDQTQFTPVNSVQPDPMHPAGFRLVNPLQNVRVDVNIEEGPETANVMGDVFDTLSSLAHNAVPVPPQLLIKLSALPSSVKKEAIAMLSQAPAPPPPPPPDPVAMQREERASMEAQARLQLEQQKLQRDAMLDDERRAMEAEKLRQGQASEAAKLADQEAARALEAQKLEVEKVRLATERQKMRLEALRLKADIAAKDQDAGLEREKMAHDNAKAEAERTHKAEQASADRDAKAEQVKAADAAKAKASKADGADGAVVKALEQKVEGLASSIEKLIALASAPTVIKRDAQGRVISAQKKPDRAAA